MLENPFFLSCKIKSYQRIKILQCEVLPQSIFILRSHEVNLLNFMKRLSNFCFVFFAMKCQTLNQI